MNHKTRNKVFNAEHHYRNTQKQLSSVKSDCCARGHNPHCALCSNVGFDTVGKSWIKVACQMGHTTQNTRSKKGSRSVQSHLFPHLGRPQLDPTFAVTDLWCRTNRTSNPRRRRFQWKESGSVPPGDYGQRGSCPHTPCRPLVSEP